MEPEDDGSNPDFDPEEAKKVLEDADPYEARLKPIAKDVSVKISEKKQMPAWSVRTMGDTTEFMTVSKKLTSNSVIVVRSLLWPGAYSFFFNGQVFQIYLGNGHKFEHEAQVFPLNPPKVMADPSEYGDQPEPTPLEEPVVVEEKKEEGEDEEGEGDEDDE